jgi:hypothetical protein
MKISDLLIILKHLPPDTLIKVEGQSIASAIPIYGKAPRENSPIIPPPLHLELLLCPN